jgi:hypothetical protein
MKHLPKLMFVIVTLSMTAAMAADTAGVVLWHVKGTHLYHERVPNNAGHQYYQTLEGPAMENKYNAWRTYFDQDDRNCTDLIGKKLGDKILIKYDQPNIEIHTVYAWGTDIFAATGNFGIGHFRLVVDTAWLNPQIPETVDSVVIDILDSTFQSPKLRITYNGWKINATDKITAIWTLTTKWEMRSTLCSLKIVGNYNGKVVAGMRQQKGSGPLVVADTLPTSVRPTIATLGPQAGEGAAGDSLMMAITTDKKYLPKYVSKSPNHGFILTPDANNIVQWAFTFSWVQEPTPLFRAANWKASLFSDVNGLFTHTVKPGVTMKSVRQAAQLSNAKVFDILGRTVTGSQFDAKTNSIKKNHEKYQKGLLILKTGEQTVKFINQ